MTETNTAPRWLLPIALMGWMSGIFGIYWDEAWHTDVGRDTFWSPPHLFVYGGIVLVGASVAMWAWTRARRGSLPRTTIIAVTGLGLTLAAGPVDDWWHVAFGRDAVVWSPPHMAGLAGVILLVISLLVEGAQVRGRRGELLTTIASAGLLAAVLVTVYEYEGDVPQFPIALYLPMLAGLSTFAFAMIARVRSSTRLPATKAAASYTGLMAIVFLVLSVMGHSLPAFTIILGPAFVFDLARRLGSRPIRAVAQAGVVFALQVLYLNLLHGGVYIQLADVLWGAPLGVLASWGALVVIERRPATLRKATVAVATGLLLIAAPGVALAHDPGFGDDRAQLVLAVDVAGDVASVEGVIGGIDCGDVTPTGLIARRAGQVSEGTITVDGCRLSGSISLPDRGRWFVYVELDLAGEQTESWIAVQSGSGVVSVERETTLYATSPVSNPPLKYVAGAVLYVLVLGGLGYSVQLVRSIPLESAQKGMA